jgi:hypothetical protein
MTYETHLQYFLQLKNCIGKFKDRQYEAIFYDLLLQATENAWNSHELGLCDSFKLAEQDIEDIFSAASDEFVSKNIMSLSEKGMIDVSVNGSGDIVYSVSELGKMFVQK